MIDMNQFENAVLRAQNLRTGEWYFAALSGIPGQRAPDTFRVDACSEDSLEDFTLWVCRYRVVNGIVDKDRFVPIRQILNVCAIYS